MTSRHFLPLVLLASAFVSPAFADSSRPDHYKGEPAPTLEAAVRNFSEYNARLEAVLASEPLNLVKLNEIHQLTYTLENALGKIQADLAELSETLEAVHLASEHGDRETAKREGQKYLDISRKLVK